MVSVCAKQRRKDLCLSHKCTFFKVEFSLRTGTERPCETTIRSQLRGPSSEIPSASLPCGPCGFFPRKAGASASWSPSRVASTPCWLHACMPVCRAQLQGTLSPWSLALECRGWGRRSGQVPAKQRILWLPYLLHDHTAQMPHQFSPNPSFPGHLPEGVKKALGA